ncbi:YoaK family protein [Sphingomonas sp. 37zxx]|uniref:YoaK family protein n=1 Tax=Sphingomonas sp. 37zxx TaxID=1550073 RepID=UPI00053BFC43|nr:YoaK family protein [Sphingomonas sp. 37zxx]
MRRYQNRHRLLAISLAILAGFVDSLGFLKLDGMFVSFMSGNSTRIAVGSATSVHGSLFAGALIAAFVVGVMAGTLAASGGGRWRKPAVLALVCAILLLACLAEWLVAVPGLVTLLMAAAMGAANAVFQRDNEVSVGVTYMTGTLVKVGQHLAFAITGGPRFAWLPYLLLWSGLIVGAIAGALVYPLLELKALWIAVAGALSLLLWSARMGPLPATP